MAEIMLRDLADRIGQDIADSIKGEVLTLCRDALKQWVMATVYSGGGGGTYAHTFEVLEAVDVKNVNVGTRSATFDVVIDTSKISPHYGAPGYFRPHVGVTNQDFSGGNLIEVLDQGTGAGLIPRAGGKFFDKTQKQLESEVVPVMVAALKSRGWDAYVG